MKNSDYTNFKTQITQILRHSAVRRSFLFIFYLEFIPILSGPFTCLYATGFGGLYQAELSVYRDSDFKWNMPLPKNYLQTKFWSNPVTGIDFYGQFGARTDDPSNKKYNFELERAWGKFWHPKMEFIALAKEERHWINSPLLNLVDTGRVVDNGLAARYDLKDLYGFNLTAIASRDKPVRHTTGASGQDESEWYGKCFDRDTNVYISRLQKNLYKNLDTVSSIDIGGNYITRKRFLERYTIEKSTDGRINGFTSSGKIKTNNEVVSLDTRLTLYGISLTSEFASSYSSGTASVENNSGNALSTEVRDLRIGPFWLVGRYFVYGKNFRSEVSSKFGMRVGNEYESRKEFIREGYSGEISYLFPKKFVNVIFKRTDYKVRFDYVYDNQEIGNDYCVVFSSDYFRTIYNSIEFYAEFVKGFKGKIGYEITENRYGRFPGEFFELSGENEFAYGRVQARIKDKNSGTDYGERYIMGGELRLNLTDRIQLYWRTVDVQSVLLEKNWSSAFYQMRYNIGWDLETYLEYGDGWITDNLAWDTDITDAERNMTHMVKLVLKLNF